MDGPGVADCVRARRLVGVMLVRESVYSTFFEIDALGLDPLPVLRFFLIVAEFDLVRRDLLIPDVARIASLDVSQVASEDERGEVRRVEDGAGDGEDGAVGRGGRGEADRVEGLLNGAERLKDLRARASSV